MFCADDLTLILFSRDHLLFVDQCLNSIHEEFGNTLQILNVDVGSKDGTEKRIKQQAKELGLSLHQEHRSREMKTLTVLKSLEDKVNTQFVILLSADDLFDQGYGEALLSTLKEMKGDTVLNFSLIETNACLESKRLHVPSWTNSLQTNKRKLSIMNPGTATGSVIPFKKLKSLEIWKSVPSILIEDYWLWWTLIEHVDFVNILSARAVYRKHGNNISSSKQNRDYAYSLGFAAGLPWARNNSYLNRCLSIILIPRWGRHLSPSNWKIFIRGFIESTYEGSGI
jgi:glycosyltransferase involved in cell wall biosynthesis